MQFVWCMCTRVGGCRSKVTIKLQKQFTTPKDAAEYFHCLENSQPQEPSPLQSDTQFSKTSHPSTTQLPTHTPWPLLQQEPQLLRQSTVQSPEARQMQTPSNPSATQHPTCLPLLPPLMALTLDPASLQLHPQQPQASQAAVQAPTSSFLLQNLQLLENQQEERGYSPLQVTKHDSLEDFERHLWSFPVEDQIQLLSELFSGYCIRNHAPKTMVSHLELSIQRMLQLEKVGRSNVLYGLASGLGSFREDGSPRFPVDRMPMGLLQHMVDFLNCQSVQEVRGYILSISVCDRCI